MVLVKDYGMSTDDDVNFGVTFYIPDNCEYSIKLVIDKYVISVNLQKGQSNPSPNFMRCSETVPLSGGELIVNFEQTLNGVTSTKPRMRVECN